MAREFWVEITRARVSNLKRKKANTSMGGYLLVKEIRGQLFGGADWVSAYHPFGSPSTGYSSLTHPLYFFMEGSLRARTMHTRWL